LNKRIQVNSPPQHANRIPARKKRVQSQLSLSHSAAENQRCVGIGPDLTAPNRSPKARCRRHLQIAPAVISLEKGTHPPGGLLALVASDLNAGVDGDGGSGSGHCDDSVNSTSVSLAMPLCTEATSSHERVGLVKGLRGYGERVRWLYGGSAAAHLGKCKCWRRADEFHVHFAIGFIASILFVTARSHLRSALSICLTPHSSFPEHHHTCLFVQSTRFCAPWSTQGVSLFQSCSDFQIEN
jgi:hypothetical protein